MSAAISSTTEPTASTPPVHHHAQSHKGKGKEKPLASLIAGATAGGLESFVTYPLESLKTQVQFGSIDGGKAVSPYQAAKQTYLNRGISGFYAGVSAVVIGNAVKAAVRFASYDQYKSLLKDNEGKLTAPRSMLAGLGAGLTEAVFAVTPSETIKTKMIEDSKRSHPRFKGLLHGTQMIIREEGMMGVYRGLGPVMLRQGANSAVRFSSYSTLKQLAQGSAVPGSSLPGWVTFGIGSMAGVITVYCTMPFDVIKTRMQSLNAKKEYRNSFQCAYRILTEEGFFKFWKGTTPRLGRLVMSGGIIFTVYEKVYPLAASVVP